MRDTTQNPDPKLRAMVLVGTALAAVTELLDLEPQQPPAEPDPRPAEVDPVNACRDALDKAEWTSHDRLTAHPHGLTAECTCDCGQVETIVGPDVPNAGPVAELAAVATNNIAAVLDRLADAEAERDQAVREADGDRQLVDVLRAQRREAHERLRTTRAHAHDLHAVIASRELELDAARARIDELTADRDQAAEMIAHFADLIGKVCDLLGIVNRDDREILPLLRDVLDQQAARAGKLADIRILANQWAEQGVAAYAITAQTAYRRDAGREILAILDCDTATENTAGEAGNHE
ncbi:hypothetical protein [Nocardia africana]|uniref:Uncharacterized protein n=1 Tax=Nocardia africana TaxID=134964 RepID=A0A378X0W5_9NOCA|nr:hypothetical protein [Nocardia africana]MCC3311492.1 hypothetical protein [Nocardia africana]SUA47246.1 Uncharacterised protein [Nocardia africana]